MQIYLPNVKTQQAFIGLFDYLMASRDSNDANVIFNSDLNLEDLNDIPGGNQSIFGQMLPSTPDLFAFVAYVFNNFSLGGGQLFQDLYVLWKLRDRKHGTFVEIGTAFPDYHNNTYLLESQYMWNGVCVEPNNTFHCLIEQKRQSPLDRRAIFSNSGQIIKMKIPQEANLATAINIDWEPKIGSTFQDYQYSEVESVSLLDCVQQYQIPLIFDYLSFDTTGNQHDINSIDEILTNRYRPRVITIGHNYKSHRINIYNMLTSYGYIREFDFLSRWDDWYFHPDYI
jgi:hypothetical protein